MKIDNLTKTLLAAIAIALWMIALNLWHQPVHAATPESVDLSSIESSLSSMDSSLSRISRGVCTNSKLC